MSIHTLVYTILKNGHCQDIHFFLCFSFRVSECLGSCESDTNRHIHGPDLISGGSVSITEKAYTADMCVQNLLQYLLNLFYF